MKDICNRLKNRDMRKSKIGWILGLLWIALAAQAESGADLWLRYQALPEATAQQYTQALKTILIAGSDELQQAAGNEVQKGFRGLTGQNLSAARRIDDGTLVIGTTADRVIADLKLDGLDDLDEEGYGRRTVAVRGGKASVVAGRTSAGALYGSFDLLRRMQSGEGIAALDVREEPAFQLRLLNHWDNLNGTVERGYAGHSIFWNREESFEQLKDQYLTYARANASVGINGTVLNNVNASPEVLNTENLERVKQLADLFRPYNIKVYLAVNFASPAVLGGLDTADPLDENVQQWWRDKAAEIYKMIPDFGGFLVKANSEGQPGPMDFGRTHQDGANMLAGVLKPHNGVVMWRAFVYEPTNSDRAMQAYNEFMPFDGKFADNVIVQVKNGPVD